MSPVVVLVQATAEKNTFDLFVIATIGALCVAGLTALSRRAGIGCLGFSLLLLSVIALPAPIALGWGVTLRAWAIAALGYAAVRAVQRRAEKRAQRALDEEERAFDAAVEKQRLPIPADAESLGDAIYHGGLRELEPDLLVELLVSGTTLWLVPEFPDIPAVPLDARRVMDMYVGGRSGSVVLMLAGKRGRNQEVELAATEEGTARQLYAVLDEALPASASPGAPPQPAAPQARVCAGCGSVLEAGAARCAYCGRPA